HARMQVRRGILSHADLNLLYIDEVNLLNDHVVDVILDAAAQGSYSVRRGGIAATYRSRFTLIGTMNPEEGSLRPQIMDRFGLRLLVEGLDNSEDRLEAYHRARAYQNNPRKVVDIYAEETMLARDEINEARSLLNEVILPEDVAKAGLRLIDALEISSLRAEITLFEGSRALAAADGRNQVTVDDIIQIAPMALRLRKSKFVQKYFEEQKNEEQAIAAIIAELPNK
ncbi:MAG: ATP-binding protein, partial [Chloroflexota bacterium]